MKAAAVFEKGSIPQYADFPEPEVQENEILVSVKAASIKNLDRARAGGNHYSTENQEQQDIWKMEIKSIFSAKKEP